MAPPAAEPHQGGDLFDMAKDGTSIPNDAGKMNIIPSKPRPGEDEGQVNANDPGNIATDVPTNSTDIPRSTKDIGATGQVETFTGDQLLAQVESKRLHHGPIEPASKGHERDFKHGKDEEGPLGRLAGEGPGVGLQPYEEDMAARQGGLTDQDADRITDERERKEL